MCVTTPAVTVQHNAFGPLSIQVIIFNDAFVRHLTQNNVHESGSLNNLKVNTIYLRAFNNDRSSFDSIRIESTQDKQPLDMIQNCVLINIRKTHIFEHTKVQKYYPTPQEAVL
jgi:hypothetical protein